MNRLRLLLARHGVTEWNTAHRFQGQADPDLSPAGQEQARLLARRLAGVPLARILCSDLRRAQRTAEIIRERHACLQTIDPDLREISFGAWEGLTYPEIQSLDPLALRAWEKDWVTGSPPGGENLLSLEKRIEGFLDRLQCEEMGGPILIVAHGGPLQVLICLALGLPARKYWKFPLANASLSELQVTAHWAALRSLNDTCHLQG